MMTIARSLFTATAMALAPAFACGLWSSAAVAESVKTVKKVSETFIVDPNGSDQGAKQPQAAVSADGRIHATFGVGNAIRYARSDDAGKSFRAPTTVGEVGSLALGMRRGPRVAAAGGHLIIAAVGGRIGRGQDGDILAWRSTDQGATWTGPIRLNAKEGSGREGLHALAADSRGHAVCVWLDLRASGTRLYAARSDNGGASWLPDALIYQSPDRGICECCHPSAAFGPDGRLAIMWRNQIQGDRDLWMTESADSGARFGEPAKLGSVSWRLSACPMDGGSVAIDSQGRAAAIWMRQQSIFAAMPGAPQEEVRLGSGVQGWIAANNSGVCAVWLSSRGGSLRALPLSGDGIVTPAKDGDAKPLIVAAQANDPMIAADPRGRTFIVVWENKSGDRGLRSATLEFTESSK